VNIRIREDGGDLLKTLMNLQFPWYIEQFFYLTSYKIFSSYTTDDLRMRFRLNEVH
jgi:hypothetical protein